MISTNYHFKDMGHQKGADSIAYFDFHSEGDGFIRFSSQKALEYSHYPVYHSGTITYKGKETPIETPMQMDAVEQVLHTLEKIKKELQKHIIGHDDMLELLLIALISRGHILIEGVPGLAKTTTVKTLAKTLGAEFKRVQFTPDLLPSDILGAEIYDPKENSFKIKQGPIFTNILLADEINRSPAKVQSALLEVMEEKQVTLGDRSFKLEEPFLVLATQNPIESQGAYELPEAQLDRFMIKATITYNTKDEELQIARMITKESEKIEQVATLEELQDSLTHLKDIHIDSELEEYMVEVINVTRNPLEYGLKEISELLRFGAGTRGTISLFKASRARALLQGRDFVEPSDISFVLKPTLRHRLVLSYEAMAEEIGSDEILDKICKKIEIPQEEQKLQISRQKRGSLVTTLGQIYPLTLERALTLLRSESIKVEMIYELQTGLPLLNYKKSLQTSTDKKESQMQYAFI
eukprot:TRINITY_DN138760_c0_g1_i1.p1 TRINITY_DN138760_c0_g1~~TRINITY_DN138760_c0_g1_i1.p1  ORF type:complete len:466 (+),score=25.28 TRINITY_DN138760_c0_g1_i1:1-1398(+)